MSLKNFLFYFTLLINLQICCQAGEILKIGDKVKAGYSKDVMDCEVVTIYGSMVTLKNNDSTDKRLFHVHVNQIAGDYVITNPQISKEDELLNEDLFVDSVVEACHPNGEWYIGKVLEKYGKFLKVQIGKKDWAPVWVNNKQYNKTLKVGKEICFMDYRHRQVAVLTQEGILKNQKDVAIGRVYSNGKVYDSGGDIVATILPDGSIEKNSKVIFKTNIQFNNGVEYCDKDNNPIFNIRVKSSSIYLPSRPDIVSVFFAEGQLKGNMRVCAGLFLLFKEKF